MLPGQLCLAVVDTEHQEKKVWVLPWSAGMAHCFSGTQKMGILLESKGGKLILIDRGREDLALYPGATQSREYAGDVISRDTGCCPETYP